MATANITIQVDSAFVHELAEAIVRKQLGGEMANRAPENATEPPWPGGSPDDDPWSTEPPAATTAPPRTAQAGPTVEIVNTPKGAQTWTLNLPTAPLCDCGQPAAHIQGNTNGRAWARYGCAKGKDRATYRSKCNFSQWA